MLSLLIGGSINANTMYLIYDTETTGLPLFDKSPDNPGQAHILQLACLLLDESYEEVASFSSLIKPTGWHIHSAAQAAHGISKEDCEKKGIDIKCALGVFNEFDRLSHSHIAHNIKFDAFLVNCENALHTAYTRITNKAQICTMLSTTEICKLPSKRGSGYKWPKLIEVYQYLFHESFDGAHDALADVRACARVFKWLRNQNIVGAK